MRSILFILSFTSQLLFGQSDEDKIQFDDYNKTTTVLIKLMEKSAVNGNASNVSIFLNSLKLLENEYEMKEKHKSRIRKFITTNFKFNKPIVIDFRGISGFDPGIFVNNTIDQELFFEYMDLRKNGLTLDQLKNIQSFDKILDKSNLELKNIKTTDLEKINSVLLKKDN